MVGLAVILITWIYFQIISIRNRKYHKQIQLYNRNIKAEEKRRIREEQLKFKRVKHPKIVYISDYRLKVESEPSKIV